MKKLLSKVSVLGSTLLVGLSSAGYVFADTDGGGGSNSNSLCGGSESISGKICGLGANITLAGLAVNIVNLILFVAFALALIFLIVGGIKWIISGGDKAQTEAARNGVTSALIGLAVVVGAYVLINVVLRFLGLTEGLSSIKPGDMTLFK